MAVQNFACRIVSGTKKYGQVTPILKGLYLAYTGMCSWTGYGFQGLESYILDHAYGLNFQMKLEISHLLLRLDLELENKHSRTGW